MIGVFLLAGFLFFFWLGYNFGRRAERWENNHPKADKEVPKDKVKEFLDNLNKN